MAAFRPFKAIVAGGCLWALAACGAPVGEPAGTSPSAQEAPSAQASVTAPLTVTQPGFVADHIRRKNPYWVSLLKQRDGGVVQYAPQTIFRYPDRTAEIWLQILHPAPLTERFEDASTFQDLTFQRERYRYLFNCPRREFTVTHRRIMGEGESQLREVLYEAEGGIPQWREIAEGGPAGFIFGPACTAP